MSSLHDVLLKAVALHQQGAFAAARALYERVLAQEPANADALHLHGVLLRRATGDLDGGIRRMRRVLALNPALVEARLNLANMLASRNAPDEAIEEMLRLLRLDPGNRAALYGVAALLVGRQRLDEAVPHLEALLRQEPGHAQARRLLIFVWRGRPRVDIVEAAVRQGFEHQRAGRLMDAEMTYRQILKANPGNARALSLFAELAARTARPALAAHLAGRAKALSPADAAPRRP